jgi:hypothetical protein
LVLLLDYLAILDAVDGDAFLLKLPASGRAKRMIDEILPAGEIVRTMVSEAEEALRAASQFLQ